VAQSTPVSEAGKESALKEAEQRAEKLAPQVVPSLKILRDFGQAVRDVKALKSELSEEVKEAFRQVQLQFPELQQVYNGIPVGTP